MTEKRRRRKSERTIFVSGVYFVLAVVIAFSFSGCASGSPSKDAETAAVLKAARDFLDAEVRRDYPAVYACFAPSSEYARSHSYEEYLAQTQLAPDSVVSYRILNVSYVHENEDTEKYPAIDKFAQVEVEVTFLNADTGQEAEVNIGFIFFKERGKWYKS